MNRWLLVVALVASCRSRHEPARTSEPPPADPGIEQPPAVPEAAAVSSPDAAPPGPASAAVEPPGVPGARLVARATVHSFAVCRGSVYWCESNELRVAPVTGEPNVRAVGRCQGGADVACGSDGVYDCGDRGLVRLADDLYLTQDGKPGIFAFSR